MAAPAGPADPHYMIVYTGSCHYELASPDLEDFLESGPELNLRNELMEGASRGLGDPEGTSRVTFALSMPVVARRFFGSSPNALGGISRCTKIGPHGRSRHNGARRNEISGALWRVHGDRDGRIAGPRKANERPKPGGV